MQAHIIYYRKYHYTMILQPLHYHIQHTFMNVKCRVNYLFVAKWRWWIKTSESFQETGYECDVMTSAQDYYSSRADSIFLFIISIILFHVITEYPHIISPFHWDKARTKCLEHTNFHSFCISLSLLLLWATCTCASFGLILKAFRHDDY